MSVFFMFVNLFMFVFLFFTELVFELQASCLLGKQALYHLSHSCQPSFVLVIFKIGFCKLFACAGFEPQSS
jgi:hypothetical protein